VHTGCILDGVQMGCIYASVRTCRDAHGMHLCLSAYLTGCRWDASTPLKRRQTEDADGMHPHLSADSRRMHTEDGCNWRAHESCVQTWQHAYQGWRQPAHASCMHTRPRCMHTCISWMHLVCRLYVDCMQTECIRPDRCMHAAGSQWPPVPAVHRSILLSTEPAKRKSFHYVFRRSL
jgi:hypothetical protein